MTNPDDSTSESRSSTQPVGLGSLSHMRDVILLLVARDFRGRYKHTRVGMLWSVMNPLMMLLIFYFLFTKVIDLGIPHYASYVYIGILFWQWTQTSLAQAVGAISSNAGLVNQPGFPVVALPVVSVTTTLLNLFISIPLLFALLLLDGSQLNWSAAFLPLLILIQFIFTLSLAYILAALNVRLRDIEHILPLILQLGYYITPIFFSITHVPAKYRLIFDLNPMVPIVEAYRAILLYGVQPDLNSLLAVAAGSLLLLAIGYYYFESARLRFLEEL